MMAITPTTGGNGGHPGLDGVEAGFDAGSSQRGLGNQHRSDKAECR
jgi:hypothetical protein